MATLFNKGPQRRSKLRLTGTLKMSVDDDPIQVMHFYGSHHADAFAKAGAKLHDDNTSDVSAYKSVKKDITNLAYHMIDVLSALHAARSTSVNKAALLPRGTRDVMAGLTVKASHRFVWQGKMWTCTHCLLRSTNPSQPRCVRKHCVGHPSWSKLLLNSSNGHTLWTAEDSAGGRLVYCSKCWSYASAYPRKLLGPCLPPAHGRPCVRPYFLNRRHLVSRSRLCRPVSLHA